MAKPLLLASGVVWEREVNGSQVTTFNRRISLRVLVGRLFAGESPETLMADYGLERRDLNCACEYLIHMLEDERDRLIEAKP